MVLPRVQVKELRRTYGFEEVAIVPGDITTNPELSAPTFEIGPYQFTIPIIASAMDAIVSPAFAGLMAKAGGLAVMNLEGVYGRYEDPQAVINWYYSDEKNLAEVETLSLEDNVIDWVMEQAKVTDKPCTFDEIMNKGQTVT